MFFVLIFSIFSFGLVNKAQAQCLPGYTMLVKVNSPSECIPTQVYNQLHNPSTTVNPSAVNPDADGTYKPLAPLPGIDKPIDFTKECPLGNYLNVVINLTIGLIAVIAMVMIVMGGIEYITSELISSKANAKERITGAIVGLLIALGSYLILNTLNPNLLNLCLDGIPKVSIAIEGFDAGDDTVDPDLANGRRVYSQNKALDPEIASAVDKLKDGWSISKIIVSQDGTMQLEIKKGNQTELTGKTSIAPGLNGYTPSSSAQTGDKKTPLGNFTISDVRYTPGQAQFSSTGSNMGAAFWELSGPGATGRGIGIHGNKNGTLSDTNGCIRLTNADILALQPYIKIGIQVTIR